jgi:hypothetical protein
MTIRIEIISDDKLKRETWGFSLAGRSSPVFNPRIELECSYYEIARRVTKRHKFTSDAWTLRIQSENEKGAPPEGSMFDALKKIVEFVGSWGNFDRRDDTMKRSEVPSPTDEIIEKALKMVTVSYVGIRKGKHDE